MAGFLTGQRITADALNVLFNKPMGRLVAQSTQTLANNTQVALTFGTGSTVIDTHGFHSESTNTTRVTPTIAGYYTFTGAGFFTTQTGPVVSDVDIRLNGTTNLPPAWRYPGATQAFSGLTVVTQLMNGTTDYVELVIRENSGGASSTNVSSQFTSTLEWEFKRLQ